MRSRRATLVVVLSLCVATGCGLVLGIDEGRLVPGGGPDGNVADTSADTSMTNPLGDGGEGGSGGDGGDGGTSTDANCVHNSVSIPGTADTFIYPIQDAGNPFGWQSSNNIGLDGAYGLFRFDLGALAPMLTARGTELTLVLTPFPLQKNQEISGTAVVHPIKSDWDEGDMSQGATWWFKRPMVAWNAPGAGGTDRGPQVSNVTITIAAAPDGGPHAFPIGDLLHTADYLGGVSGNELTFLVAPDSASAAMRLWIAGHEVSPPNGTPPILVVATCAP